MKSLAALVCLGLTGWLVAWMASHSTEPSASWSPYQVGAGIGVLSWLTFYFCNKPISASSSYANFAGMLGEKVAPQHTAGLKYYQEHPPKLNWESVFILATVLGAFLAAFSAHDFGGRWLPPMWELRFGADSLPLRFFVALAGGILMALGARLAGGCTSGHGISGTLQLAVSSWLAVIALFVGGIVTAMLVYGGGHE